MNKIVSDVLSNLKQGNYKSDNTIIQLINTIAMVALNSKEWDEELKKDVLMVLDISNILYNNTHLDKLPLDDGVYDILLEAAKANGLSPMVGAAPININIDEASTALTDAVLEPAIIMNDKINDFLFLSEIRDYFDPRINGNIYDENAHSRVTSRIKRENSHDYPTLVGTLDKVKFVLNKQAIDRECFDDNNVKVFERDFFAKTFIDLGIPQSRKVNLVAELKYDGVSVEATVSGDTIISARTRGDAVNDIAADMTHLFGGYKFPYAKDISNNLVFGIKFEAIIDKFNLERYCELRGKRYANCRTAIASIFESNDAYLYKDFITLVPLQSEGLGFKNRSDEIEFLNAYYNSGEPMRHAYISAEYLTALFQVKAFTDEAEYLREALPFMYDGVVIEFLDNDIREALGRKRAVNKYAIAIKFESMSKLSVVRGITYTVGQDGRITPKVHYDPVEFFGTIHPKSSLQSYGRFMELGLRYGDIIRLTYVNDVMPYVDKPNSSANAQNNYPVLEFPTTCPICGGEVKISETGRSAKCINPLCDGRKLSRIVNMLSKLNIKDFGEAYLASIGKYTLRSLMGTTYDEIYNVIGPVNAQNFMDRINYLKTTPIYDYSIMGALGFTSIGSEKWKKILYYYSILDILSMYKSSPTVLSSSLSMVKTGKETTKTIVSEFEYFVDDIQYIIDNMNIITTKGSNKGKKIRFTGVRDSQLVQQLISLGHSAGEGSITKDTDYLIVPYDGYTSSKVNAAIKYGIKIVPIEYFAANLDTLLSD